MQFYPPGWVPWPAGIGCTANQWCAALNIDTFSENDNTGQFNNTDCLNTVGPEPVNFAFLTKNGVATSPANPAASRALHARTSTHDFLMNPGDNLTVRLFDTANGLRVGDQRPHHAHPGLDDGQRGQRVRQRGVRPERRPRAR